MSAYAGLVLAGRRGPTDPLAEARGASHRALLEMRGVPMLLRVVRTLRSAKSVGRIAVSIEDPEVLSDVPELRELMAEGSLVAHASRSSPSRSVLHALQARGPGEKLLVTTADHPLPTPEMVDHLAAEAERGDADVAVGVVAGSLLRARFPATKRTYLRLRDDDYSGANLFAFRTERAERAAAFWTHAEQFRKRPWRLVGAFGPLTLLLYALRRLDLGGALERVSVAMQARVRPVLLPFAEAAIDVDRSADFELVSRILAEREPSAQSTTSPAAPKRPVPGS